MIAESFDDFKSKALKALEAARDSTKIKLSDNPDILINQLSETSAHYSRLQYILADAEYWYRMRKAELLPAKDLEGMAFERQVKLEAAAAAFRHWRDMIDNYAKALRDRISLGQSALGYYKEIRSARIG